VLCDKKSFNVDENLLFDDLSRYNFIMNEKIKYIKSMANDIPLLYVEDNEGLRKNMLALLERIFDKVISAKDGYSGYDKFIKFKPKIVTIII